MLNILSLKFVPRCLIIEINVYTCLIIMEKRYAIIYLILHYTGVYVLVTALIVGNFGSDQFSETIRFAVVLSEILMDVLVRSQVMWLWRLWAADHWDGIWGKLRWARENEKFGKKELTGQWDTGKQNNKSSLLAQFPPINWKHITTLCRLVITRPVFSKIRRVGWGWGGGGCASVASRSDLFA